MTIPSFSKARRASDEGPRGAVRLFLSKDAAAVAVGADAVAAAITRSATAAGRAIDITRTGSRGLMWLEPLVEVDMTDAAVSVRCSKVTVQAVVGHARSVPAEVPVALVYDGTTRAVMMASPSDLENVAVGVSLTEGIVSTPEEISSFDVLHHDRGIELRMWLTPDRGRNLAERRRRPAGPTGRGLCGIESLEAAVPACPRVTAGLAATAARSLLW